MVLHRYALQILNSSSFSSILSASPSLGMDLGTAEPPLLYICLTRWPVRLGPRERYNSRSASSSDKLAAMARPLAICGNISSVEAVDQGGGRSLFRLFFSSP